MRASVLTVGTELLAGKLDTNGPELGRLLAERGFDLRERLTLGDELAELAEALAGAIGRGGLVVMTGGLGPTRDDLTREAIALATGRRLAPDASVAERLRARALELGRPEPGPESLRQALVPDGARALANPAGTAPGLLLAQGGAVLLVLPGPPRELRAMAPAALAAAVELLAESGLGAPPAPKARAELHATGLGESAVARALAGCPEVEAEGLEVAWLARPGLVSLHFCSADEALVAAALAAARSRLGEAVFSEDGRSLAELLISILREREETVGTIESCTGGLVAAELTSVPGSSAVVRAGLVVYSNEAKLALADLPPATLAATGAVSRETALALAEGGRRRVQADWSLAVTGIAGPGGGTAEKPVGTVWTAIAGPDGLVEARLHRFPGDRAVVRELAVAAVLDGLRRRLLA